MNNYFIPLLFNYINLIKYCTWRISSEKNLRIRYKGLCCRYIDITLQHNDTSQEAKKIRNVVKKATFTHLRRASCACLRELATRDIWLGEPGRIFCEYYERQQSDVLQPLNAIARGIFFPGEE